jgi:rod shape determining protein RodA
MKMQRFTEILDWPLFFLSIGLTCLGLLCVMSATYLPEQPYSLFFKKQCIGAVFGCIIFITASTCDHRKLMHYAYFAYFTLLLILMITIIKGSIGMGAQRWINLGIIKLQPSELCKLLFPASLSYYLYTQDKRNPKLIDFIPILLLLCISSFLIFKQPDLGTAILIALSGFILIIAAGLEKKWCISLFFLTLICAPAAWYCMKPYQQKRILVYLGHGQAHKERYQIEQSKIAIGSGGLWGKGYRRGTQNILQFLPESRTDFIFAVLAEEFGFVGVSFLLMLYLLLIFRLLFLALNISQFYAQLVCIGLIAHIALSAYINICMVIGLLPIVGIPLPLMSYGLSNLWVVFASLGWCSGIYKQRRNHIDRPSQVYQPTPDILYFSNPTLFYSNLKKSILR